MTTFDSPSVGEIADALRPYAMLIYNIGWNKGFREGWEQSIRERGLNPADHPVPRRFLKPTVEMVAPEVAAVVMELLAEAGVRYR